ncbi:MAG: hypothetical protein ACRDRN_04475 [Sciscionella sp.]
MPPPRRRPRVAGLPPTGTPRTSHRAVKTAKQVDAPGGNRAKDAEVRQEPQRPVREWSAAEETAELPEEITAASEITRGYPEPAQSVAVDETLHGEPETGEYDETDKAEHGAQRPRSRKWLLPTCLIVIAVVLAAFAAFAGVMWRQAKDSSGNSALTDAATTNQATTQVSNALNTLLAFDYKKPNKNDQAVKNLIDGKLGDCGSSGKVGYDKLMGVLKQQGPKQQLTLRSTVLKAGVQQLQGDRAQLLVLLDQEYSKGAGKAAKQSSAVVAATVQAVNKNGGWKLRSLCLQ